MGGNECDRPYIRVVPGWCRFTEGVCNVVSMPRGWVMSVLTIHMHISRVMLRSDHPLDAANHD